MIYRSWSMLTGTAAITGGVVAAVVAGNFIFVENNPFLKPEQKKSHSLSATK